MSQTRDVQVPPEVSDDDLITVPCIAVVSNVVLHGDTDFEHRPPLGGPICSSAWCVLPVAEAPTA